ncbi:MAG: helix-hairpin-helix domain-containing protein [Gemmatimonadaceae bacterium]|nr:helix-hairpin-helix domain-containing protein [Gemmatimonadaceae bacterium]
MPTPAERQALLFFAAVAALGVGVNAWRAARGGEAVVAGSATELAAQIARVDSAVAASPSRDAGRAALKKRNAERANKKGAEAIQPPVPAVPSAVSRPPSAVSVVDMDFAPTAAIESLPRIGPALAKRIVANRDSFGAFGSMDGLQRVRGIGPALAKTLAERVRFSGTPRPDAPNPKDKGRRRRPAP